MKHILSLCLCAISLNLSAAVPLRWTVETSSAKPAAFDEFAGATYDLEAALQSHGRPLAVSGEPRLYWQTNGMGSAWWTAPATASGNVLRATWTPDCDVGARAYSCFIGIPGSVYNAAFQLRLRPSPGATPNELPLPQKVIDFAQVTVLNPPWSGGGGGGVDTNAVRDIILEQLATNGIRSVNGSARPLPKHLHALDFDDSYPDAAQEYYRSRGDGKTDGGCSAVRDGGYLYRNFDYPFDDRAEFVVKMSAGKDRFASVGVAQIGTNLTEEIVTSGKPSRCYKWLPGATVDGINEHGVACNINVVDGDPQTNGWHTTGDLNPLGAIRWILDNATNAQHGAEYIAANIRFPQGWAQNFHYMVADECETWIVENGTASNVTAVAAKRVMTNFAILPEAYTGMGAERYQLLRGGANITNAWYTRAYRRETNPPWVSDLAEVIAYTNDIFDAWAAHDKEYFRSSTNGWWQSVHTSIYDISNRVLRVAVQEVDDWYTFVVPSAGGVKPEAVREIVSPMIGASTNGLRRVTDMAVYEVARTENTDWTWTSDNAEFAAALNAAGAKPYWYETGNWTYDDVVYVGGIGYVLNHFEDGTNRSAVELAGDFDRVGVPGKLYATARRPRYMDEIGLTTSTNAALVAVATNGTGKVSTGDMVKLGANGRLVKATAGIDYSTPSGVETAIEEYDRKIDIEGLRQEVDAVAGGLTEAVSIARIANEKADLLESNKADRATTISGYGITDAATKEELKEKAGKSDLDKVRTDAANALSFSRATFDYMNGNTNAWFSGTNYVVGADNTNRTHFAFEDGMDLATVPCSMSLWEIRDGAKQCVWDQRDWTVWFWNFKIEQYRREHDARDAFLRELISRCAPLSWSSYTACGLTNAATDTTWLDTPKVVLSAGYAWQHQATVEGVGYWGIQGNGCEIGGYGTNATLRITDWEGNEVLKITKGSARLAYIDGSSGVGTGWDDGYMWYDMKTGDPARGLPAPQPIGEFSVDLLDEFVVEGDNCPAEVREYEDRGNGVWRCYFRAKPGINASSCFARFKVQTGKETTVEYANPPTINGGLIYQNLKIAPVIPANAAVGDVITWKVVQ